MDYIDAGRDYECCRYFDLIKRAEQFFADGIITNAELDKMDTMRQETLTNYQVAADMLHEMDPKAKDYDRLTRLVDYLRRCWRLMDYVTEKGELVNKDKKTRSPAPENKGEKLALKLPQAAAELVAALATPVMRREANADYIARAVRKMPPAVREQARLRIGRAMQALKQTELEQAIARMADLERTRG